MKRYFKEYICVGGLPESVNTFLNTGNMSLVYQEQMDIIEEYKEDFGKHLDENEKEEFDKTLFARILETFNSIPSQLAKENKKFQYSKIKTNGRSNEYSKAIQWLVDAGMVSQCFNLSNLKTPFEGNKIDNVFKLYMSDSGLFTAMLGIETYSEILDGNLGIYKGAIFENMIADAFYKNGKKLYYYRKDSGLEIDFITKYCGEISLVEVKATTGHAKSARQILTNFEDYKINKCIKFGEYNIGERDQILTLPYYLAFLI